MFDQADPGATTTPDDLGLNKPAGLSKPSTDNKRTPQMQPSSNEQLGHPGGLLNGHTTQQLVGAGKQQEAERNTPPLDTDPPKPHSRHASLTRALDDMSTEPTTTHSSDGNETPIPAPKALKGGIALGGKHAAMGEVQHEEYASGPRYVPSGRAYSPLGGLPTGPGKAGLWLR